MSEERNQVVQSWLIKALHDLASARKLAEGTQPYLDTAIYHCQQAAANLGSSDAARATSMRMLCVFSKRCSR